MARLLLIFALIAVVVWVYSIVDCAMQPATRHRGVSKSAWMFIVILLPVVGGLLWFLVGRARTSQLARSIAPDDDPAFLGSIGSIRDQDERIKRLEEELAMLDAEGADPDGPPAPPAPQGKGDGDDDTRAS